MKLLAETRVTLVITDIFMPGQDGIVTLRRIKKEFPGVRVIAVSGGDATGRIDLRKDAELLGAARTLRKTVFAGGARRAVEETLALESGNALATPRPRAAAAVPPACAAPSRRRFRSPTRTTTPPRIPRSARKWARTSLPIARVSRSINSFWSRASGSSSSVTPACTR